MTAAAVAPLDLLCATGTSYFGPPALPYVPGVQGVGVVVRGDGPAPGTRVWFSTDAGMRPGDGSLAEAAVVPADRLVPLPRRSAGRRRRGARPLRGRRLDGADPARTAPARGSACWSSAPAASSGRWGSRSPPPSAPGSSSRPAAASRLGSGRLRRGATAAVDLADADVDELERRLRAAAGGEVDLVLDPVCGDASTAALRVLAEHGRLVHLGSAGGPTAVFASAKLRSGSNSILGYTNNSLMPGQREEALTEVLELAAAGRCYVEVERFRLADVAEAWTRAGSSPQGRVVVQMP